MVQTAMAVKINHLCDVNYWSRVRLKVSLKFLNKLWWLCMPGVTVRVRWPSGNIVVDHNHPLWQDMGGAVWADLGFSCDPNDHYRPWMESVVGRQGWDWDWVLTNDDVAYNTMTIKFRRGKEQYASVAVLQWT